MKRKIPERDFKQRKLIAIPLKITKKTHQLDVQARTNVRE